MSFHLPSKLELVAHWRTFYKLWSVRFNAMGVALLSGMLAFPQIVADAWTALPPEMKALLPQQYVMWVPVALMMISMYARIVRQPKLIKEIAKEKTDGQ
jgi:hypothetical protein